MAFLRIDGFEVDALIDGFDLDDVSVESYTRATSDQLEGLTYADKKQYSFDTPPLSPTDADALEGWIQGRQHFWSFSRTYRTSGGVTTGFTRTSSDAGVILSGSSQYGSTASRLWANSFNVGLIGLSGATSGATAAFGSEGDWTIHGWHATAGDTWTTWAIRSSGGSVLWFLSGASNGTLPFVGYSTASGYLGVALYPRIRAGGTTATAQYTGLSMSRFAWSAEQLLSVATWTYSVPSTGFTRKPFLVVSGDGLQTRGVPCNLAGEKGPVYVKGFVESLGVQPVTVDGTFRYNARSLRVRLVEQ